MTALPRPFAVEVGGGLATFKAQGHWCFNLLTYCKKRHTIETVRSVDHRGKNTSLSGGNNNRLASWWWWWWWWWWWDCSLRPQIPTVRANDTTPGSSQLSWFCQASLKVPSKLLHPRAEQLQKPSKCWTPQRCKCRSLSRALAMACFDMLWLGCRLLAKEMSLLVSAPCRQKSMQRERMRSRFFAAHV